MAISNLEFLALDTLTAVMAMIIRSAAAVIVLLFAAPSFLTPASASDPTIRNIQRLLWSLDYGVDRINGVDSAANRGRVAKFLADNKLDPTLGNRDVLGALHAAFDRRRSEAEQSGTSEFIDRRPLADTYTSRMVVVREKDLVLAGKCDVINRFKLSNSASLREFRGICNGADFGYSNSTGHVVASSKWDDTIEGVIIYDPATSQRVDFIEVPDTLLGFGKLDIHPNGNEVVLLSTTNLWHINLQSRVVKRLSGPFQSVVTQGVRVSPDGRYAAAYWSKKEGANFVKHLRLWDLVSGRALPGDYAAEQVMFSPDGARMALLMDGRVVEVRETQSGRIVTRRKFESASPDIRARDQSAVFTKDGSTIFYVTDYGSELREWSLSTGQDRLRFKLPSSPDLSVIDLNNDKLHALLGSQIRTFDLTSGKSLNEPEKIVALSPRWAAMSPNGRMVAMHSETAIVLVSTEDGSAREVKVSGMDSISALAFMPDSERLLLGGDNGRLAIFNTSDSSLRTIGSVGTEAINSLVVASTRPLAATTSGKSVLVIDLTTGRIIARTACEAAYCSAKYHSMAFVDEDQRLLFADRFRAAVLDIASGRRIINQELKTAIKRQGNRTTWMWGSIGYIARRSPNSNIFWVGVSSFGSNVLFEYVNGRLTPRKGDIHAGGYSFFPAGASVAAVAQNGSLYAVLQRTPKLGQIDDSQYGSQHLPLRDDPYFIAPLPGGRFVTADSSGEVRFYRTDQENPVARTLVYANGDWLSRTENGFFSGTRNAAENLFLAQGPNNSIALDNFYNSLYRPDMVREQLTGDVQGSAREAAKKLNLSRLIESGPAPLVSILPVTTDATSSADTAQVSVRLEDRGGGIGKVEWRVNGLTLGVDEAISLSQGEIANATRMLALENGDNVIEVLAYNRSNLTASDPARTIVKLESNVAAIQPRLHIIAVGINEYWDSRLRLSYAVDDAKALTASFEKASGNLYDRVEVTHVLDADVTISNLEKVFTEVGRKVRPRDVFVLFVAGHGKTVDGRYYFLPQDFRYDGEESIIKQGVNQDLFQAWLSKIPARKSMLLYDTCESGSLTGDRVAQRGIERIVALEKMTRAMGRTVLSASTEDTPALEGYRGHGVFTYALLEALNSADANGDGMIEVTELASYIDHKVPEISFQAFQVRQIPQMKIVGSNFPLTGRFAALKATSSLHKAASLKPTHVVIASSAVREAADDAAPSVMELAPGTQVVVVSDEGKWVSIARGGKIIGFVSAASLVRLQ